MSLHIPWDKPDDAADLRQFAAARGLTFDAMNSNTFQDQPGQRLSYKFGSLTHTDAEVRRQAIAHNLECIEIGKVLGSKALTVWIADGGNFPAYVAYYTDFSPARATPLDRDIRVSNSREQIETLWTELKAEYIVKGWAPA